MKSTNDDLHAVYRQTTRLSRAHKSKLITWLTEDVSGQPVKVMKKAGKKGEKKEEAVA